MSQNPIWIPTHNTKENSSLKAFMRECSHENSNYQEFWQWSINNIEQFWSLFWDFCSITGEKGDITLKSPEKMTGGQFFSNGTINYAENILCKKNNNPSIITKDELGNEETLSFQELHDQVSLWAQAFIQSGIKKGDRIAAHMPNRPETIIACLAAASIGAIWSSASPDFGAQGLIDRFEQIDPKILITTDGYYYGGKEIDCIAKIKDVQLALKNVQTTIVVPFIRQHPKLHLLENAITQQDFLSTYQPKNIEFAPVEFNHPLFIMFSSGTTGAPKCIVHGHGGTLLQHIKEHRLQCDIQAGDRIFYFTTCGWMMWNWLISALGSGATLLLYDGNPFYPNGNILWDFCAKHKATFFGTSAKYIDALKKANITPQKTHDLTSLKTIASTGSPLVHESFDYVYDSIKQDVHLASISGGTDIVSCFILGNVISPVYRGEIQGAGLGMAMDVIDENGQSLPAAEAGELVCRKPFPSMPVCFWNDEDGSKYQSAYFVHHKNIWRHGDWVEKTPHNGFIIHGRSDATLNPGGVRIGTSEIYRQVEKIPDILESIAVGQEWKGDVRVLLFVCLKDGIELNDDLKKIIKTEIKAGASPRHVPAHIIQVSDIPRTKSGKITELAVRDVIHGREIKNKEALANPKSLELFKNLNFA